ncbi:hypothetical protein ACFL2M_01485 [Patescibacteria group bacterium]
MSYKNEPIISLSWKAAVLAVFIVIGVVIAITWPLLPELNSVLYGSGEALIALQAVSDYLTNIMLANMLVIVIFIVGGFLYYLCFVLVIRQQYISILTTTALLFAFTNYWHKASFFELSFVYLILPACFILVHFFLKKQQIVFSSTFFTFLVGSCSFFFGCVSCFSSVDGVSVGSRDLVESS